MARPTTKDLARVAGVSRATVDRVLNGRDGVKKNTVDKVNAAIRQLGFERNLSAANLAKGRTYRFVFVLPESGDQFLEEILRHIREAGNVFAAEMVWASVQHVDGNDPHAISTFLSSLSRQDTDGVAIMAPESPQVRDAITRLQDRGLRALPFISNQALSENHCVGIDNRSAGRTAATLMGRFIRAQKGQILVIAESMRSRDSIERRYGFDEVINARFPHLTPLPSLETYGSAARTRQVLQAAVARNPDVVGAYILSSEARIPLDVLEDMTFSERLVSVAHERTPCTEASLLSGRLDAVITQDPGHLVRSAIRRLRALCDNRNTLNSQEKIRVEILLPTNL
ncbi:LacI family DNA-binding transcriptional regulator [Puniceibacterium confluentis]|uniref:LacI family DNA-binding transcriptional regulator n=1 Tax=Puniceibacterium confluentis TaxID=1958944 RepID=UPI001FE5FB18|nr:LacI family DNA-binding transcriptional regulator [Puniceibacterium confluentis]